MSDNPYLPDDLPEDALTDTDERQQRSGCLSPNAITLIFLVLTGLVIIYVAILLANPYVPINPFPPRTPLPVYVVATADPNRPTDTPPPTKLPETPRLSTAAPTITPTPTATSSPLPTATQIIASPPRLPSATPVLPTPTLISGGGAAAAVEGVFTPPPSGDPAQYTPSAFPFTVYEDAVTYIANPNDQGCRWASIAGSATDLEGQPISGLAVHVVGEGIDEIRFTGTALTYGPGGFEIFLNGAPLQGEYVVQLLSQTGSPISEEFTVETSPVCEENVAIVNFVQNHAY